MKKLFLAFTMIGLLATMNSCKDDEPTTNGGDAPLTVEQKQRALVTYVGHSALYGPAGSDAVVNIPIYNDVVAATNTNNVVAMTYQPIMVDGSGNAFIPYLQSFFYKNNNDTPFISFVANGLLVHMNPPTSGYPANFFFSAGSNMGNIVSKDDVLGNANGYVSSTPDVGIAVKAKASGNTINIDYKAKAYAPEAGAEYYVSVLVVEKNGTTRQAAGQNDFRDLNIRNIVRTSAITALGNGTLAPVAGLPQTNYTGINAMFGSNTAAGAEVSKTVSTTYKPLTSEWEGVFGQNYSNWKYSAGNTAVIAIVWKWYPSESKAYYSNCAYANVN